MAGRIGAASTLPTGAALMAIRDGNGECRPGNYPASVVAAGKSAMITAVEGTPDRQDSISVHRVSHPHPDARRRGGGQGFVASYGQ